MGIMRPSGYYVIPRFALEKFDFETPEPEQTRDCVKRHFLVEARERTFGWKESGLILIITFFISCSLDISGFFYSLP